MSNLSLCKVVRLIFGCSFIWACGMHPDAGREKSSGSAGSKAQTDVVAASAGSASIDTGIDVGVAGAFSIDTSSSSLLCKKSCDPGECGPINDGCERIIDCGGCVAPDTCGGAGIPSHCGSPLSGCVPTTCADLHATCGSQSDGCGHIIDCWSAAAKATGATPVCEVPGALCIEGSCRIAAPECKKLTCDDYLGVPDLCGPVSDGCGGTLACGFACPADKICGVIELGKCGTLACIPMSCEAALQLKPAGYCGIVPDGCGGIVKDCGGGCAVAGESCGGGGVADVCGKGAPICIPLTTAACGNACGQISDGCGGVVHCSDCQLPETCGGGGVRGQCGRIVCEPRTCASVGATCGTVANGCGGQLDCGACALPKTCGGGGLPNKCGAPICAPMSQQEVCTPGRCGPQSDGCGGVVDCGGCTLPNTCGGGGTPSVCGAPPCTKRTCASAGANCGPISDGCGGIIATCGSCTGSDVCGAVYPSVCGAGGDPNCSGLCAQVDRTCPSGNETRLTGKVFAPNGIHPIYNAVVYVPNAPLPAIAQGPSCDRCQDEDLGSPIAATITGSDGAFVLRNVPAGVEFPLVVKIGKWRRVVTIPAVARCTNLNLTADQARLPKRMNDATPENVSYVNIPHVAAVTGSIDAIECVVRKMGVEDSEFTHPSGNGRIHIYRGNGGYMGSTTDAMLADLFKVAINGKPRIYDYDMAVFDCDGAMEEHNTLDEPLRLWANAGGRIFASHYGFTYLHDNGDFANSAVWGSDTGTTLTTGIVDTTTAKGKAFDAWLGTVGAWHPTYGDGYIAINDPRYYTADVKPGSERLVYTVNTLTIGGTTISSTASVQQFSFNTPWGADADHVCGRVLYSAFHVTGLSGGTLFPSYCPAGDMTAQEKVLMFALFDLASCVTIGGPSKPPTCKPRTCLQMDANCGQVADGCGGLLNCGNCTAPSSCGGGGVANQCGNACTHTTCGAQGANCGIIADGCGGTLSCGTCVGPAICGGGGTPNVCGAPKCTPRSCTDVGATCGVISDGCGGTINCGTCVSPATCGGGGKPNVCGVGVCSPLTCGAAKCGFVGDGCGGTVACGTCDISQTCVAGVCVGGACTPRTCAAAEATCGFVGDGCGGVVSCGSCPPPLVCGGGGIPSQCGGSCTQRTCAEAKATCGAISDGCGGIRECGDCPPGQSCGGGGVPNQCAAGDCVPRSCAAAGASCGSVGDGCGDVLDCGQCVAPETCGGAGVPNQCGKGGCIPLTCAQQNANCGPVADGCGGLLDCGVCTRGQTCGGDGIPSRCGGSILY